MVFIAEIPGGLYWSGLFGAQCSQRGCGNLSEASLDEAVAWGREHAAEVYIRLGDGREYMRAGSDGDPTLAVWPGGRVKRRRMEGFEHLDRTDADESITWAVGLCAGLPEGADEAVFAAALGGVVDEQQAGVRWLTFEIDGRTVEDARAAAMERFKEAWATTVLAAGLRGRHGWNVNLHIEPAEARGGAPAAEPRG